MENRKKAMWFLVIAAVLWSTAGVVIKWMDWSAMAIVGVRSLIAAVVIRLAYHKEKLTFSRIQWAGAAAYCGIVCLFVIATKMTTAANAILLQYTAPIYVAFLGGWLLGEKTTRRDWIVTVLVFGGIVFFFLDQVTIGGMIGNLCAIGASLCFAAMVICMRLQKGGSPFGSVFLGNILACLIALPFIPGNSLALPNVLGILFLGVFQLGLPFVLYTYSIQHVKALQATLTSSIEPILNPVWVFLFLGETPGFFALIGGIVVVSSITLHYCLDKGECTERRDVSA